MMIELFFRYYEFINRKLYFRVFRNAGGYEL